MSWMRPSSLSSDSFTGATSSTIACWRRSRSPCAPCWYLPSVCAARSRNDWLFACSACADKPRNALRELLLRLVENGQLLARRRALRVELGREPRVPGPQLIRSISLSFKVRHFALQPCDLTVARGDALDKCGSLGVHRNPAAFERAATFLAQVGPDRSTAYRESDRNWKNEIQVASYARRSRRVRCPTVHTQPSVATTAYSPRSASISPRRAAPLRTMRWVAERSSIMTTAPW